MSDDSPTPERPEGLRRRRLILYAATLLALLLVLGYGAVTLLGGSSGDEATAPPPPLIVERIRMNPVGRSRARGLAELLRRNQGESMRVIAAPLRPTKRHEVYQLLLVGGSGGERLLGNVAVGSGGMFIGEAKIGSSELRRHRRLEIRLTSTAREGSERVLLRGKIPR